MSKWNDIDRTNKEYADDYISWNSPEIKGKHNLIYTVMEITDMRIGYCDIVYHTGVIKDKHTALDIPLNQLELITEGE
tara:strand:- start:350 stop:583 length:234 start_codon:yes stop_codon:yes gene_type:complete